jgi:hypothetical protein
VRDAAAVGILRMGAHRAGASTYANLR